MPNDAKLGLLAGIVGVVIAAVVNFQAATTTQAEAVSAITSTASPSDTPIPPAKPSRIFGRAPDPMPDSSATIPVSRSGSREFEGKPVSRTAEDDE